MDIFEVKKQERKESKNERKMKMKEKLKKLSFVGTVFFLLFGSLASTSTATVYQQNIYTQTGLLNPGTDPGTGPNWTKSGNNIITIGGGGTIWIGVTNVFSPLREKRVHISFHSDAGDCEELDVAVRGYNNDGKKVGISVTLANEPIKRKGYANYGYNIKPQPAYEIFCVSNHGTSEVTCQVVVLTSCDFTEPVDPVDADGEKDIKKQMYFGTPESPNEIRIDQIAFWHDSKEAQDSDFLPPEVSRPDIPSDPNDQNSPTGTWSGERILTLDSIDPIDPNAVQDIPQGGWLWSCLPFDRGIWGAEDFGWSLTTETLAGGKYWFVAHDRQRDEWFRFLFEEEDIQFLRSDLNQDGYTNFYDFSLFAQQWLEAAP